MNLETTSTKQEKKSEGTAAEEIVMEPSPIGWAHAQESTVGKEKK